MHLQNLIKESLPVEGSEGYFIHPSGRVFKIQEISQFDNGSGYLYSKIDGGDRHISIHREVAKAFIDNRDNLDTVDHIDGNKHNNSVDNLQWMSFGDNVRKAYTKQMVFVHDDGRVAHTSNIRRFARDNKLDPSSVSKVVSGKLNHTGGWRYNK